MLGLAPNDFPLNLHPILGLSSCEFRSGTQFVPVGDASDTSKVHGQTPWRAGSPLRRGRVGTRVVRRAGDKLAPLSCRPTQNLSGTICHQKVLQRSAGLHVVNYLHDVCTLSKLAMADHS